MRKDTLRADIEHRIAELCAAHPRISHCSARMEDWREGGKPRYALGLDIRWPQHQLERELARAIADGARLCDIVTDDGLDAALALGCVHEVVAELGRGDFRDVLVMRDGEHLVFRQLAKREAVFQAKHVRSVNLLPLRR
jgi:hypothetical protein